MHLTNYAINKESENFIQNTDKNNDDVGSKRSMQSILEGIDIDHGSEALEKLQKGIYDIIIKSLSLSTPHVTHLIRSCHPDGEGNQLCF
jgi:tubulin polyglutamylase TTLL6/13